jgi:hypothetical protein
LNSSEIELLNKSLPDINKNGIDLFGFLDVLIEVNPKYPLSPLIVVHEGKLTDVIGSYRVVRFTEEINFILKHGGIIKEIYTGLVFDRGKPLYNFSHGLFENKRNAKHDGLKAIYKLLLNSAYGRFALKENFERTYLSSIEEFKDISEIRATSQEYHLSDRFVLHNVEVERDYTRINTDGFESSRPELESKINPNERIAERAIQIASAITSYSRIRLISQVYDIIDKGGNVYYLDTDSVYSDLPIDKHSNISDNLGD